MSDEQSKRVFISYLDENGETFSGFVDLIKSDNPAFVKFRTATNIISVPVTRVLKMKEKDDG